MDPDSSSANPKDSPATSQGGDVNEKKHMIERNDDGNKPKRAKLTEDSTPSEAIVAGGSNTSALQQQQQQTASQQQLSASATTTGVASVGGSMSSTPTIKTEDVAVAPTQNAPGRLASAETLPPPPPTTTTTTSTTTTTTTTMGGSNEAPSTSTSTGVSNTSSTTTAAAASNQVVEASGVSEEEQRRKQEEMRKIELEFTQLKERFFNEKITQLKREIEQLTAGTHHVFLQEVKHLEERRNKKLMLAEYWRKFHARCVDIYTESEKKTADDEFQNETKELHDRMMKNIVKKRKQLEDEKRDLILNNNNGTGATTSSGIGAGDTASGGDAFMTGGSQQQKANTRTLRKRGKDGADGLGGGNGLGGLNDAPAKKPNTPDIRVSLTDEEVEHDIMIIMRGQLPSAL